MRVIDGWLPYASAPHGALTDEDDGSCEWGLERGGEVVVMSGWDHYYWVPTHWRRVLGAGAGDHD